MNPKVRLALVQSGLATFASTEAELTAACTTLFGAHDKTVPTDPDACAQQIRALTAAIPAAAPAVTAPTPPVAAGGTDTVSVAALAALVQTAGAMIPAEERMSLLSTLTAECAKSGSLPLAVVQDKINAAAVAANPPAGHAPRIEFGNAAADKFRAEATSALVVAGMPQISGQVVKPRSEERVEFQRPKELGASALQVAKEVLMQCGVPAQAVARMDNTQIAQIVMGDGYAAQTHLGHLFATSWQNVTGMYQNLLLDAGNVMLRKAYEESAGSYSRWAVRGEDFADYRPKHLVEVGVLPDPTAIGEDGEFDEVSTVDGKEIMRINEWGERFTYSYVLLANDTLGGLIGRHQQKMGAAMSRKENRLVYQELKDNPTLTDTGAVFNTTAITTPGGHNNLATGAISNYTDAISGMVQRMALQPALGKDSAALGLRGRFLLAPPQLELALATLLTSTAPPTATHAGVNNTFRGAYELIIEAELSAAFGTGGSNTAFYLVHDGSQTETVLYSYLRGQNAPIFGLYQKPGVLGFGAYIHRAFGTKALGWRAMQKHTGA